MICRELGSLGFVELASLRPELLWDDDLPGLVFEAIASPSVGILLKRQSKLELFSDALPAPSSAS